MNNPDDSRILTRLKGGQIQAKIPYAEGRGPKLAKSVKGYHWNREGKFWSYPLSYTSYDKLSSISETMKWDLIVAPALKMWVEENAPRVTVEDLPDDSPEQHSTNYEKIKEQYPKIYDAITSRKFQSQGVDYMSGRDGVLLADDPGLGKTLQTLATFVERDIRGPILIVANKSAQEITWPNEIRKWLPGENVVVFNAKIKPAYREQLIEDVFEWAEKAKNGRIWVIMNPYWLKMKAHTDKYGKYIRLSDGSTKMVSAEVPEIFRHHWAGVVADESHETLACATGNAKKWSQQRQGLGALKVVDGGLKVSISGTPMRGNPSNLFGQLQWLDPIEYSSYWNWAKKHFKVSDSGYGGAMEVEIGDDFDEKAFFDAASEIIIRRNKSTVAPDLPPKQYPGTPLNDSSEGTPVYGIWLPMLPQQKKQYEHFVANQEIIGEEHSLGAVGALAVYTRMKQLACSTADVGTRTVKMPILDASGSKVRSNGEIQYERDSEGNFVMIEEEVLVPKLPSNKYEWLLNWLEERDLLGRDAKGTGKVIIASQFRQLIDLIADDLWINKKTKSFQITGATSAASRVEQQDEFQNNPDSPKIFFVQSKAGGTSLTLDAADDVIILDEMWDPDVQTQIEDRAHRLSRHHNVSIWYVRSLETVEEYIGATVEERNRVCRAVLDGSQGIDIKRKLVAGK